MFKKTLAVAALGAALTVAPLALAGTASADEGSFVRAAHNDGWNGSSLVGNGYTVCNFLYQGYSEQAVVTWVYYHTGASVSYADAGQFVALAEDHLC